MTLQINGRSYSIPDQYENSTLLVVLREYLHLMGTKKGCGTNDCGACKVIIDGEAVNSCAYLAKRAVGKSVTTIEGLETERGLHPLQQAFIDYGAVQCGFCTPGMILTAKALLDRNCSPTGEQIREAIGDNICRCTGYVKIIDAIQAAAAVMRMEKEERDG